MIELWTIEQVAAHLGIKQPSARGLLSRWEIRAVDYQPGASGRPQARFNADEVRAAAANRPGQGRRTDLAS